MYIFNWLSPASASACNLKEKKAAAYTLIKTTFYIYIKFQRVLFSHSGDTCIKHPSIHNIAFTILVSFNTFVLSYLQPTVDL